MQYSYNDGRRPAGRYPRLYLVKGDKVWKFVGQNIPGIMAIAASKYDKCGKWSNTTYSLDLAPGVRALYFLSPIHGIWGDNKASWGEIASELGLPIETAKDIVGAEFPDTADRLNKLEEFSIEMENSGSDTETVIVSFGSPSNRAIRDGFWGNPKSGTTSDGRKVTISPNGGWDNPTVIEPPGSKVISSKHTPGMHGGYWSVEVLVPLII